MLVHLMLSKGNKSAGAYELQCVKDSVEIDIDETPESIANAKRLHAINLATSRGGGGGGRGRGRGKRGGRSRSRSKSPSGNERAGQNTASSSKKATH